MPQQVHLDHQKWTAENGGLTPSEKIRRHELAKRYSKGDNTEFFLIEALVEIRNMYDNLRKRESEVSDMVSEVLGHSNVHSGHEVYKHLLTTVSDTDSFLSLGGDSLTAVQLVQKIKDRFQVSCSLHDSW